MGTLIRHAGPKLEAGAVGTLMVAVVEATEFARLVAGTGPSQRPEPGEGAALIAAVDLPPVTTAAKVEDRPATGARGLAKALPHGVRSAADAPSLLTRTRRLARLIGVGVRSRHEGSGVFDLGPHLLAPASRRGFYTETDRLATPPTSTVRKRRFLLAVYRG